MTTTHQDNNWQWQEPGAAWKGVAIYHLTLTVPSRQPLLGSLLIPDNDPKQATIQRTELGEQLVETLLAHPTFFPEVRILQFCLMPDHLHAILHVTRPMKESINVVVRSFWQGAKKLGRAYSASLSSPSLSIPSASHAAPCPSLSISPASHAAPRPSLLVTPASHAAPCPSLLISPQSHWGTKVFPSLSLFVIPASHAGISRSSLSINSASHAAPRPSLSITPASHAAPRPSLLVTPASHAAPRPSLSITPASHAAPCPSLSISPASHAGISRHLCLLPPHPMRASF